MIILFRNYYVRVVFLACLCINCYLYRNVIS